MENKDSIRDRILSRLPQPGNVAAYREEMVSTLAKNEKKLRRETIWTAAEWGFAVGFFATCLWSGPRWVAGPAGHFLMAFTFLFLIFGAVEIVKHFVNRSRVEILKEVKQLQLQVLELRSSLEKSGNAPGL
jgi:hypothetical protein